MKKRKNKFGSRMPVCKFAVRTPEEAAREQRAIKMLRAWFAAGCPRNFDKRRFIEDFTRPLLEGLE